MRLHDGMTEGPADTPCNAFCKPPVHVDLCYAVEHAFEDTPETLLVGFQDENPVVDVVSVTPAPESPPITENPQFDHVRGEMVGPTKPYLVTWTWRRGVALACGVRFPKEDE